LSRCAAEIEDSRWEIGTEQDDEGPDRMLLEIGLIWVSEFWKEQE